MSCREVHLRLCSLISDSLRTYAERIPSSFTKENARDLLIVLSQVCSQIKLWTSGIASESDSDMEGSGDFDCVIDFSIVNGSDTGGHLCLSKAINVLTKLLALDNPYVQHLVGNNLVAISDFIIASGSSWGEFKLLLSLLKLAILSSIPSSTGPIRVDANSAAPVSPIKLHHTSDNWSKASVIIQVLRRVLKGLKQDVDDHFLKVFLELMNSLISKMPWDLLDEVFVRKTSKASGSLNTDGVLQFQDAKQNPAIMFLGGFIQLFCSLLGLLSLPIDAVTDDSQTHTIVTEIRSILPRLLDWCLGNFQNIRSVYISKYYKHKFLILMIRLSSTIQSDCSVLLTWLHFIHLHFQDDLCLPIAGMESDQDNCLEGSPFWEYVSDAAKENISPRHLQRLAILLFLRCSFCLINSERSCQNCVSTDLNSSSTGNLKFEAQCCPRIIGFQEIHKWLQLISNDDAFLDTKKCAEFILSFQLSFIQLYMHEDDILFQMLLELLSVPLFSREWFFKEGIPSRDANASSVVLDLFNPIHLFHHFLAVIHYDHQVLLDYLISKDTGASSAEYMLRCLRVIFNSWSLFQNFQWIVKKEIQLFQMRRKTSIDHMNFHGELFTSVTDGICLPVEQNQKKPKRCGIINSRTERQPFECASNCLLELRTSIESLHQKSLFPYNPQVLLQRLSRFRELCQKQ